MRLPRLRVPMMLLLALLPVACSPVANDTVDVAEDPAEDTSDSDAPGEDTDTGPDEVDCEPQPQASQPEADRVVFLPTPCGGVAVYVDADRDGHVLYSEYAACEDQPYMLHVVDVASATVTLSLPWPDLQGAGGAMALGPMSQSSGGTGLARTRTDESFLADLEINDLGTGDVLGTIDGHQQFLAFGDVRFFEESIGAASSYEDDSAGLVRVFDPPWREGMSVDDASAVHHTPEACEDCLFGSTFDSLGDVTGDGLADAVVGGAHEWFLDGELLHVDEGASQALELQTWATATQRTVSNVGDFDGDGLEDWATTYNSYDPGASTGKIDVLRGAEASPFASVVAGGLGLYISESLGGVGDVDGNGRSAMAVLATDMGYGAGLVYLVDGGVCGTFEIGEVAAPLAEPSTFESSWFASAPGLLAIPGSDLDDGVEGLLLLGW